MIERIFSTFTDRPRIIKILLQWLTLSSRLALAINFERQFTSNNTYIHTARELIGYRKAEPSRFGLFNFYFLRFSFLTIPQRRTSQLFDPEGTQDRGLELDEQWLIY